MPLCQSVPYNQHEKCRVSWQLAWRKGVVCVWGEWMPHRCWLDRTLLSSQWTDTELSQSVSVYPAPPLLGLLSPLLPKKSRTDVPGLEQESTGQRALCNMPKTYPRASRQLTDVRIHALLQQCLTLWEIPRRVFDKWKLEMSLEIICST